MTFDQSPSELQIALFTDAAKEALAQWHVSHVTLELLSLRSNAVFLASYPEHPDDLRMILRVNWPGRKSLQEIRSEGLWLDVIARHGLSVPRVIRSATDVNITRSPMPFICSLYAYQTGESYLPRDYSMAQVREIGRFAANLHHISSTFPQSVSLSRPRLDAEGIFGADSLYASGIEGEKLLAPYRAVLDAVRAQVETVFGEMDKIGGEFSLIHGDLKPDNLLFDGDTLRVLDFDDCARGYMLYDLAPMLLFIKLGLRADQMQQRYDTLKRALWDGYTSVRAFPDSFFGHLETLAAGRFAASCLWVASRRDHPDYRDKVEGILASRAAQLAAFLHTGEL